MPRGVSARERNGSTDLDEASTHLDGSQVIHEKELEQGLARPLAHAGGLRRTRRAASRQRVKNDPRLSG